MPQSIPAWRRAPRDPLPRRACPASGSVGGPLDPGDGYFHGAHTPDFRNGSIDSSGLRLIDRRPGLGAQDLAELPARAATVLSERRSIRVMMILTFWTARWRVPTAPPWAMSLRQRRTFPAPAPAVDRRSSASHPSWSSPPGPAPVK